MRRGTGKYYSVESAMNILYEYFREKIKTISSFDDFLDYFFMYEPNNNSPGTSSRYHLDILESKIRNELINENRSILKDYLNYCKETIYTDLSTHNSYSGMKYKDVNFTDFFVCLLRAVNVYRDSKKRKALRTVCDNSTSCNSLPAPLKLQAQGAEKLYQYYLEILETRRCEKCTSDDFVAALIPFIHYLANGHIGNKYNELINGLESDRQEYVDEVLMKYGSSGKPGIYAIYRLANKKKPNIIALYEAGELAYYGRGYLSVPDYAQAFDYYEKAVKGKKFNPLAAWCLGFMYYHYREKGHELENAVIPALQGYKFEELVEKAVGLLNLSLECGCPAAANVLAQIADDKRVPCDVKIQLMDGLDYLRIAAEHGYVFALNNLGEYYLSLSQEKCDENFEIGYDYYRQSAELGEAYAMNKYAKYYLWEAYGDIEQAIEYFVEAANLDHEWAMINVLMCIKDEEQCKLVKKALTFNADEEAFNEYISRLCSVCSNSRNKSIRKAFEEWNQ